MTLAAVSDEIVRLRMLLGIARESLEYVDEHHADGKECLCDAARSVVATGLRLSDPERESP